MTREALLACGLGYRADEWVEENPSQRCPPELHYGYGEEEYGGRKEHGKGERPGYFKIDHQHSRMPAGRFHRVFFYPAGHPHLVCGIDQAPVYAPRLGLRAGLDIPLYLNGDCRVSGLAQRSPSPGREEGPGNFRGPANLKCALVLFIFWAEVSPGRPDRNIRPGNRHHFHRPRFP